MRVLILTPQIHFHAPIVMRDVFQRYKDSDIEFYAALTPKLSASKKSTSSLAGVIRTSGLKYLLFMIFLKLKFDLFRLLEKASGRPVAERKYLSPLEVCEAFGAKSFWVENINSQDDGMNVADIVKPDVILSLFFNQILGAPFLESAREARWNLHPSLLPEYKGRSRVLWMLAEGAKKGGATLHHMTNELDAGNIVEQKSFDIDKGDSFFTVYRKAAIAGAELLISALALDQAHSGGKPQRADGCKTYGPITGKAFNELLEKYSFFKFEN